MEKPIYQIETSEDGLDYVFDSINQNKVIKKAIRYYQFWNDADLFELVFGNLQSDGTIDVKNKSDNKIWLLFLVL